VIISLNKLPDVEAVLWDIYSQNHFFWHNFGTKTKGILKIKPLLIAYKKKYAQLLATLRFFLNKQAINFTFYSLQYLMYLIKTYFKSATFLSNCQKIFN
jgi:hypothetical protein